MPTFVVLNELDMKKMTKIVQLLQKKVELFSECIEFERKKIKEISLN